MDRESLRKIQKHTTQENCRLRLSQHSFLSKDAGNGNNPDDINSIDDIVKLPFTTKHDLRDNYPFGLCAVPMRQIVRIHHLFRNDRKPTVVGYTHGTWPLGRNVYRAFTAYGAGRSDVAGYHTDTDCLRADWEHMPEPRILVLLLFRCPVATLKNRLP